MGGLWPADHGGTVSERIERRVGPAAGERAGDAAGERADDAAVQALRALVAQLERIVTELQAVTERADQLISQRAAGWSWREIVDGEQRPLIIETITRALDDLGEAGSRFRREEALALRREQISITRISKLFGVSRQRVSTLLQERGRT
jgi:hypothetical protein